MPLPLSTIEELATLLDYEPDVREILVEGSTDRSFVEWFLAESDLDSVGVSEIEEIEVDPGTVLGFGYLDNNKGRVLTTARLLETLCAEGIKRISCIVDGDFDHLSGTTYPCSSLLFTDYSCLEMYAFNPKVLGKVLTLNLNNFPKNAEVVLAAITPPLEDMFLYRMANHNLRLGLSFRNLRFTRFCKVKNGGAILLEEKFINQLLISGASVGRREEFLREVARCRLLKKDNPRFQINGHDFIHLLAWFIRQHRGARKLDGERLGELLMASIEFGDIRIENLFSQLVARAS